MDCSSGKSGPGSPEIGFPLPSSPMPLPAHPAMSSKGNRAAAAIIRRITHLYTVVSLGMYPAQARAVAPWKYFFRAQPWPCGRVLTHTETENVRGVGQWATEGELRCVRCGASFLY